MNTYPFDVVWMTSGERGTPHARVLQEANPKMHSAAVCVAPETGEDGWRNCDRNIRAWWMNYGRTAISDWVLFLEWDVYCNVDLREVVRIPSRRCGLVCAGLVTAVRHRRMWPPFAEVPRLPVALQELAIGCVPSAVLLLSRAALDAVSKPDWDEVFRADILSELRLGTVIRACGFEVAKSVDWDEIGTIPRGVRVGARGIFHPVKMEVES